VAVTALFDVDFAALYRDAVARAGRAPRPPEYWSRLAQSTSESFFDEAYVEGFVRRMDLSGCRTLLDVGCGPGAIGLAAAARLEHVYGLDYCPDMLTAFRDHARTRRLQNVTPILRSWDDPWSDVPVCDIVVASRSTTVPDLEAAFLKLESKARRRVYVTYPADGHFVGDDVCRALGRPAGALPDYLHAVGILHHLGRYPTLDYLPGENRLAHCPTFDSFLRQVVGLMGPLTADELGRLEAYYQANRERFGHERMRWAFCGWEPPPLDERASRAPVQ
jgi:SAM-dependent methyltransferase